jgi:hypothetical protein
VWDGLQIPPSGEAPAFGLRAGSAGVVIRSQAIHPRTLYHDRTHIPSDLEALEDRCTPVKEVKGEPGASAPERRLATHQSDQSHLAARQSRHDQEF